MKNDLLDRVRKLLAKAEDEGCTPHEAEALTAKAAELMARYGIDRALLGSLQPGSDKPANRKFYLDNPWGAVKAHLLAGLASALRCQCILLHPRSLSGTRPDGTFAASVVHVFGWESDLERLDILFTSLLVQMARALAAEPVPAFGGQAKAWRRSFMLGYASAVVARVRAAEAAAVKTAEAEQAAKGGPGAAVVLASRETVIKTNVNQAYPKTRKTRVTYSGNGYQAGYREGQKADIGGARVKTGQGRSLTK